MRIEDERVLGKMTGMFTGLKLVDLNAVKTSLAQAVALAEQQKGGKAIKVQVENEHGSVQFDVFVRVRDHTPSLKIDAMSSRTL